MKLNEYLFYSKISRAQAADFLECDARYLGQVALGRRNPGRRLIKRIDRFTNGQVPASYWESEEFKKYLKENERPRQYKKKEAEDPIDTN